MKLFSTLFVMVIVGSVESTVRRINGTSYLGTDGRIIQDESERDFYPTETTTGLCQTCSCSAPPQCDPGVSLVLDGCGCCKVCAGQLGDRCDREKVCDHHKGLYCDENTRTCKARPGRNCFVANKWYENGALFSPSCRIACSCMDGDIGCFPKCKPPPAGCAYPRLARSSSNCCGEWRCTSRPSEFARGHGKSSLSFRDNCILQTTPWSPCSKSCDFGISERVTNENTDCKMTKETRLCMIRPCKQVRQPRKGKRKCRRNLKRAKRVRYSLSGCYSTTTYRPRYCGTCRHREKCCKPSATKTIEVEFRCEDSGLGPSNTTATYTMKRKMMTIQKCVCGKFCSANDLTGGSIRVGLTGDTYRGT